MEEVLPPEPEAPAEPPKTDPTPAPVKEEAFLLRDEAVRLLREILERAIAAEGAKLPGLRSALAFALNALERAIEEIL